jgi:hypothetical protein
VRTNGQHLCGWISQDWAVLQGTGLEPPTTLTGDKTVFCCSHVELEYFEVYFLYNNGVFDISHHSVSTLEILESQDLSCEFF